MSAALPNFNDGPLAVGHLRYSSETLASDIEGLCHTASWESFSQQCNAIRREDARRVLIEALDSVSLSALRIR